MKQVLARCGVAVIILVAWWYSARAIGTAYVADPIDVARRVAADALAGRLGAHISSTLRLSLIGLIAGALTGVATPLLLAQRPRLSNALMPFVLASAGIPKYSLIPLFILWFGIDDAPKLWLIALLVFYPVFIATHRGIQHVRHSLVSIARVLGASRWQVACEIVWPSLLPFLRPAMRIAVPRAVSAAIIGELLVGDRGVGFLIESSRQTLDTTGMFAGLVVATGLVVVMSGTVAWLDAKMWVDADGNLRADAKV